MEVLSQSRAYIGPAQLRSPKALWTKYVGRVPDRKALELFGEVTVGDMTAFSASLTFAKGGIKIVG